MIVNNWGVCGEDKTEISTNSNFVEDLSIHTAKNAHNIVSAPMPTMADSAFFEELSLRKNTTVDVGSVVRSGDGCGSQIAFEQPLEVTHTATSTDVMPVYNTNSYVQLATTSVVCSAHGDAFVTPPSPMSYGRNFVTPKIENNDFIASTSQVTSVKYNTDEPLVMPIEIYRDGDNVMPSFDMANFDNKNDLNVEEIDLAALLSDVISGFEEELAQKNGK